MTDPMNGEDKITITRWIDKSIDAIEQVRKAEREADKIALKLQAVEYERRLESLNNENARIQSAVALNVSPDKFYALEKDTRVIERTIQTFVDNAEYQRRIGAIEKWQTSIDGKLIGAFGVITLVSVIIGIVSHFWK